MSEEEKVVNEENQEPETKETKDEELKEETPSEEKKEEATEVIDYQDRWMRVTAEYQNYRVRTQKEKAELYTTATFEIAKELIEVVDTFELALKNINDEKDREGIDLIYKKLLAVLDKNHVKEIPALGLECDLKVHNKIAEITVEGKESGIVVDVTKKGYTQGDKVIRPADVVVSQ